MVTGNEFNKMFARKLAEFEGTPEELSDILKRISESNDKEFKYSQFDQHIDPFNALAFCNRGLSIINDLKKAVGEEFGFDGNITEESAIPLVNNLVVSFVSRAQPERNATVDRVWDCFRTFVNYADGRCSKEDFIEAFDYCTTVKGMVNDPHRQLTMGLYWIDSEKYVSLDSHIQSYLTKYADNIKIKKVNGLKYLDLADDIHSYIEKSGLRDFNDLSDKAYNDKTLITWDFEDFESDISEDEWCELLKRRDIFTEDRLFALKTFYDNPDGLTCTKADDIRRKGKNFHKSCSERLAENIQKETQCNYPNEENAKYWPILYYGRYLTNIEKKKMNGEYMWKLRDEVKSAISKVYGEKVMKTIEKCDYDKNTILYGPPGTGKTYSTYRHAVQIIDGMKDDDFDFKKRFDELYQEKRICFVTFHQSYSYEEFIEGIRPRVDDETDTLRYELKNGVFKEFCNYVAARSSKGIDGMSDNPKIWKVSLEGTGPNETRRECLKNGHIRIGWDVYGETITDETDYFDKGKIVLNSFINKMQIGDIVLSCFSSKTIDAIGIVTGDYEWNDNYPKYKRLRKVKWVEIFKDPLDIIDINAGKVMTLSTVYEFSSITKKDVLDMIGTAAVKDDIDNERYVFIIDEINRGNVSRIFGELITLIEESKRVGASEELKIPLPYSGERFGVPSNVYIIGTMNTVDRSLVALDSALRRRFSFIEMMPDVSKIEPAMCGDIDLRRLLETINQRIKKHYDKEHMIGHSYLMGINSFEDLQRTFEKNIIPLLQEYFYDDEKKIKQILICANGVSSEFIDKNDNVVLKDLNEGSYIRLYDPNKGTENDGSD